MRPELSDQLSPVSEGLLGLLSIPPCHSACVHRMCVRYAAHGNAAVNVFNAPASFRYLPLRPPTCATAADSCPLPPASSAALSVRAMHVLTAAVPAILRLAVVTRQPWVRRCFLRSLFPSSLLQRPFLSHFSLFPFPTQAPPLRPASVAHQGYETLLAPLPWSRPALRASSPNTSGRQTSSRPHCPLDLGHTRRYTPAK